MSAALRGLAHSLRGRLLVGTLVWIVASVALAGWGLSDLFRQHLSRQFFAELTLHMNQLTAAFNQDDAGGVAVSGLSDPRFEQPFSGLYWQVDRLAEGTGKAIGLLRSRSLWDQDLATPGPAAGGEAGGRDLRYELEGPQGRYVTALVRTIRPPEGQDSYRLIVAADRKILEEPIEQFGHILMLALGVLAAGLAMAAGLQVFVGLRPMVRLRRQLALVHDGHSARIQGRFPSEVQPLVDDFNAVLESNEAIVQRARTQAGNLAHALKTPLAVLANAAENQPGDFGQLVRDQTAQAQRQVAHHLAQARAVVAAQAAGAKAPLGPVIEGLLRVLRKLYQDRGLEIALDDVPARLVFRGQEQDLQEILGNVLENACKWANRRIHVGVSAGPRDVTVFIDDDGPGLRPEQRELIFQRGVRLDERRPGSGLGLSIVKDLVEVYGGDVHAEDSPLGGLRVALRLPAM